MDFKIIIKWLLVIFMDNISRALLLTTVGNS